MSWQALLSGAFPPLACALLLLAVPVASWPLLVSDTGNVTLVSLSDINLLPGSSQVFRNN